MSNDPRTPPGRQPRLSVDSGSDPGNGVAFIQLLLRLLGKGPPKRKGRQTKKPKSRNDVKS
jgi:hypothetical protein